MYHLYMLINLWEIVCIYSFVLNFEQWIGMFVHGKKFVRCCKALTSYWMSIESSVINWSGFLVARY